jgi:hypothetical protein
MKMILSMFVLMVCAPMVLAAEVCHPEADGSRPQFVIGYGSLMEDQSRRRTAPHTGEALPAMVSGFERSFISSGNPIGFSTTFLGVTELAQSKITAAVYRIFLLQEIVATDARERSYCRVSVDPGQIQLLDGSQLSTNGQYWIYVNKPDTRAPASEKLPLVQSYIDIFMTGCQQLSQRATQFDGDFMVECLRTTKGWSVHWVNDRLYPRRPFIYQPNAGLIDRLLDKYIPEFKSIRIE